MVFGPILEYSKLPPTIHWALHDTGVGLPGSIPGGVA
jgi:hypothetical protein